MANHRTPRRHQSTYQENGGRTNHPYIPYVARHGKVVKKDSLIARLFGKKKK